MKQSEQIVVIGGAALLILYFMSRQQNPYGAASVFGGSNPGGVGGVNSILGRLLGTGSAPRVVPVSPRIPRPPVVPNPTGRTNGVCPTCPQTSVLSCSCPYASGQEVLGCNPCAIVCAPPVTSGACYGGALPTGNCGGFCFGAAAGGGCINV